MEIFVVLFTIVIATPFLLPYVIPYVRRYHKPIEPPEEKDISLDPSIFKAKRRAQGLEHRVWSDEFLRLAGHTWLDKPVEPEIWDEAADETLRDWGGQIVRKTYLTKKCKHTLNEVCIHCDR